MYPLKKEFLLSSEGFSISPVYKEIPYKNPAEYFPLIKQKNSFIFQSIKGPFNISRYSYIGFEPYLILKVKDSSIEAQARGGEVLSDFRLRYNKSKDKYIGNPLLSLKDIINQYPQETVEILPPFQGGAVGLLSYDYVRYFENIPRSAIDDLHIPDAHFFLVDKLISFDHLEKKAWIVLCPGAENIGLNYRIESIDWNEEYDKAVDSIYKIESILKKKLYHSSIINNRSSIYNRKIEINREMTKNRYMDIVRRVKEYIAAGDIFQANMSQRISSNIKDADPWDIYTILSSINPSPFACFLDFDEYQIVSSSPERLVKLEIVNDHGMKRSKVYTRPIAGTRPRGKNLYEDNRMRDELLLNEKERAEHIMLIDLERNDLGRVCDYNTIKVDEMMITENYSHVIHIVSNIAGTLAEGKDCFDIIRAVFPGGTITGVPKVRCMEIIDELEPVVRGPYTGSVGYLGFSKAMDLNIIIRTFIIKNGIAYVQAGAGIVADSDPEREYLETLKKAEALIMTLKKVRPRL